MIETSRTKKLIRFQEQKMDLNNQAQQAKGRLGELTRTLKKSGIDIQNLKSELTKKEADLQSSKNKADTALDAVEEWFGNV